MVACYSYIKDKSLEILKITINCIGYSSTTKLSGPKISIMLRLRNCVLNEDILIELRK
jgi:hypothetical protein